MKFKGFTLIELMIVIAVIAVIAAISMPMLFASQRASNERNASASIKVVLTANLDYRTNDRNDDGMPNYWCASIAGLYTTTDGLGQELRLIDVTVALADADADQEGGGTFPAIGSSLDGTPTKPKAGYWYEDIETSETGEEYDDDDDDHNNHRFGYACWPDAHNGSGKVVFIVNQTGVVYRTGDTGLGGFHEVQGGSNMPDNLDIWPGGLNGPLSTGRWSGLD